MGPVGPSGTFSSAGFEERKACSFVDGKFKVPAGTLILGTCEEAGVEGKDVVIVMRP
jgi:hypothetical protein